MRLKGDGPKFYPKAALEALGFSPSGDYNIGFEIVNFEPVPDIDPNTYELERKGQHSYTPYFTTIDKFQLKHRQWNLRKIDNPENSPKLSGLSIK